MIYRVWTPDILSVACVLFYFIFSTCQHQMPRKTVGLSKGEDAYDYEPLISPGITMLKFGRGGTPHERYKHVEWNNANSYSQCQGFSDCRVICDI